MTQLSHNSRRQRRRVARHMIHRDLVTFDITSEEILAELEPYWFQGIEDGGTHREQQVGTEEAAA